MCGHVPPKVHPRERFLNGLTSTERNRPCAVAAADRRRRVWGAETLPTWFPAPAKGKPIGEAWLTAGECTVEGETSHGRPFAELVKRSPAKFGADSSTTEFPLLLKLLFPREKLSVQVHPDDTLARSLGQRRGKTECWYVLSAEPGASVMLGFAEDITPAQVREAITAGTLEQKLRSFPVKAGDMVYIPAGTVHAIGPGMMLLETQQTSDVTYRLFDYGRPRELHVEQGIAVMKTTTEAGIVAPVSRCMASRASSRRPISSWTVSSHPPMALRSASPARCKSSSRSTKAVFSSAPVAQRFRCDPAMPSFCPPSRSTIACGRHLTAICHCCIAQRNSSLLTAAVQTAAAQGIIAASRAASVSRTPNRKPEPTPMFVPATFAAALLMTILSTICWGSFANTLKGTKNYRFELYNWDYTVGIFVMSVILALTMGSTNGGPTAFLANMHAADTSNLWYAGTGGFIFNIANVLLIAGIEITGLASNT